MKKLIAGMAIIAATTGIASGCINDEELQQHEREFRSQYLAPQMTSSEPPQRPGLTFQHIGLRVAGVAMLGAALGAVWKHQRNG